MPAVERRSFLNINTGQVQQGKSSGLVPAITTHPAANNNGVSSDTVLRLSGRALSGPGFLEDAVSMDGWPGPDCALFSQLGTYPIVAELGQTGSAIKGEMYDQITERADYLDEFYSMIREDMSPETRHNFEQMIRYRGLFGRFLPPHARGTFELYRKS